MRKTIAAAVLALACGTLLSAGTASAATPTVQSADNCVSYKLTKVNGQWKLVPTTTSGCTSSSTGTSGSSGSSSGTSTQGTVTNNCNTGCTGSATGTAGRSR